MNQIIQNIRSGRLSVMNVPDPTVRPGQVLIANISSVISSGTERMVMDLARKSLLGKAKCATKIQYFIQCGVYAIILSQEDKINHEDGAGHKEDS